MKYLSITFLTIVFASIFWTSCDKIEEPYFKPVYTERITLSELVADASNIDESNYNDFINTCSAYNNTLTMLILSGNTDIAGNSSEANSIVSMLSINTQDSLAMFDRKTVNGLYGVQKSFWNDALNNASSQQTIFNLSIDGSLNQSTQTFAGEVEVRCTNGYQTETKLTLYVVRDSVVCNNIVCNNVLTEAHELANFSEFRREQSETVDLNIDLSEYNNLDLISMIVVLTNNSNYEILQASEQFVSGITFTRTQNVLIEDFTGHLCGSCPRAHEEITRLHDLYGHQLIPMAIHYDPSGYFTSVTADYPDDFRTEIANEIGSSMGVQFNPIGYVNRIGSYSDKTIDFPFWENKFLELKNKEAKAGVVIDAIRNSNLLSASVYVKAFEQLDTLVKIQGFILEDGIISKQTDYNAYPTDIEDYEHNHVLRASINGLWGEDLTEVPFAQNSIVQKEFNFTLDQNKWNVENLTLIIIIYNDLTREIIQVESVKL
ncbi:MAG: Omp28-related outer membrane protein [Bacteroidales bacterium]|nr:Omp28-related outer membrane protein [Bacteroidales bacterium]